MVPDFISREMRKNLDHFAEVNRRTQRVISSSENYRLASSGSRARLLRRIHVFSDALPRFNRIPPASWWPNSQDARQSKLPIENVVPRTSSSHICTQPRAHGYRSGSTLSTKVGAGCSCHSASTIHHLVSRFLSSCLANAICTNPGTIPERRVCT